MNEPIDLLAILDSWDIPAPIRTARTRRGTNNLTWQVDNAAGSFILRIYQNVGNLPHVAYEHALLRALSRHPLSFFVPVPIPSRTGEDTVQVRLDTHTTAASLFPLIPGRHPEPHNVREAELSGAALGELDDALQRVILPSGLPEFTSYGEIRRVHPLVPDPFAAVEELRIAPDRRSAFQALLVQVETAVPALYAELPRQIIHSDIDRSSVLIEGERVTGILDFEFASPDVRAMDFAVGLFQFAVNPERLDIALETIEAYARGYARWTGLQPAEVEAIPALWRLRQVVSVLHRLGRWRQGAATEREVTERVEAALLLQDWLRQNGAEMIHRVGNSLRR